MVDINKTKDELIAELFDSSVDGAILEAACQILEDAVEAQEPIEKTEEKLLLLIMFSEGSMMRTKYVEKEIS